MISRISTIALAAAAILSPLVTAAPAPYAYPGGSQPSVANIQSSQPSAANVQSSKPVLPIVKPGVISKDGTANIPQYVKDYAPVLWLYSKEQWFPSLIQKHLDNINATVDYDTINTAQYQMPLSATNLDQLNSFGSKGSNVYLTAKKNLAVNGDTQDWLLGEKPVDGKSAAPVTLIVVDKGNGVVDAFWMLFYSYNKGPKIPIINKVFGNHVGDWEHMMVRFLNGVPQSVYMAQHSRGQAFTYNAVEKYSSKRPVAYVATGTHATYSTVGDHDHAIPLPVNLPFGFLVDKTNKGTFWDPMMTEPLAYWWDTRTGKFSCVGDNPEAPLPWLNFVGNWGDKMYKEGSKGQNTLFGQHTWEGGPSGPYAKNLNRTKVCPDGDECVILPIRTLKKRETPTDLWKRQNRS